MHRRDRLGMWCRRREFELDVVCELGTVGSHGSGGHSNDIAGCGGDAVDCARAILESHGFGPKPDPSAWHFWRDRDRCFGVLDLRHGGQAHHGLVEGH